MLERTSASAEGEGAIGTENENPIDSTGILEDEFYEYDDDAEQLEIEWINKTRPSRRSKIFHGASRLDEIMEPTAPLNPDDLRMARDTLAKERDHHRRQLRAFKQKYSITPDLDDETSPEERVRRRIQTHLMPRSHWEHEKKGQRRQIRRLLQRLKIEDPEAQADPHERIKIKMEVNFKEIERLWKLIEAALKIEGISMQKEDGRSVLKKDQEIIGELNTLDNGKKTNRLEGALREYGLMPIKMGETWNLVFPSHGSTYATLVPLKGVDLDRVIAGAGDHQLALDFDPILGLDPYSSLWNSKKKKYVVTGYAQRITLGPQKKVVAHLQLAGHPLKEKGKSEAEQNSKGVFELHVERQHETEIQEAIRNSIDVLESLRSGDLMGKWVNLIDLGRFKFPRGYRELNDKLEAFLKTIRTKNDRGKKLKLFFLQNISEYFEWLEKTLPEVKASLSGHIKASGNIVQMI